MENQQQSKIPASIGGEPLEGSGFETEQPVAEDELVLTVSPDQRKGEEL